MPASCNYRREIVNIPGMRFLDRMAVHHIVDRRDKRRGRWESIFVEPGVEDVLVLPFAEDGKTLILVKVFRFPVEDWIIELPGGCSRPSEILQFAAARELREETGFSSRQPLVVLMEGYSASALSNARCSIFLARGCRKTCEPNLDSVEISAGLIIERMTINQVKQAVAGGRTKVDASVLSAIFALEAKGLHL